MIPYLQGPILPFQTLTKWQIQKIVDMGFTQEQAKCGTSALRLPVSLVRWERRNGKGETFSLGGFLFPFMGFLPGDFSGSQPKTSVNLILNLNDLDWV